LWIDKALCKLCLVCSRTRDLVNLGCPECIPKLLRFLAGIMEMDRTDAFSESFDYIKKLLGSRDPYERRKRELNEAAGAIANDVRTHLAGKNWNIYEALRISAAANVVDTSVLGYESKSLVEAVWEKPAVEEQVELPKRIYLVLDNAGEALIDVVMAEALIRRGHEVTLVVRSESYEIDVLKGDVNSEVEIVETPGSKPPILYIDGFVIAKGIANAEACMEREAMRSLHLFRAKCDVLAEMFGVPKGAPIIISGGKMRELCLRRGN